MKSKLPEENRSTNATRSGSDSATSLTLILDAAAKGDCAATNALFPIVYTELRYLAATEMAKERPDHTLQPTALVHEVFLRLVGQGATWENRRHFFGAAAEAMRRILIEFARAKAAKRRGGKHVRVQLELADEPENSQKNPNLMLLDEALHRMENEDPRMAEVVKLRFFAGLSVQDTAKAMGVSTMTVSRDWRYARAWLYGEVFGESDT